MLKYVLTLILIGFSFPVLAQGDAGTPIASGGVKAAPPSAAKGVLQPGLQIKADPETPLQEQVSMEDIKRLPIVRRLLQSGGEVFYLGGRSGLQSFLLYKSEHVQIFHLSADLQVLIFGSMFSADGVSITERQVGEASSQNAQLRGIMTAAAEQQQEFEKTSGLGGADADVGGNHGLPASAPLSPGERLILDFKLAAGVVVGQPDKPLLYMLVDPLCPHCQATWKVLKDPVAAGVLQIKLLPVGPEGGERERMAAKFLHIPEPLKVWNKLEEGDPSVLNGVATPADLAAIRSTMSMVMNWKITATPYLVYRGKNGKVKVVQGEPEKIAAVLADLAP